MSDLIVAPPPAPLARVIALPPDQCPALVYLASLAVGSRRTMAGALAKVAEILAPGTRADELPWHELRFQHVAAVRSTLLERGLAPKTINRILAAVKGVLRAAVSLEQMSAEAASRIFLGVKNVKGERPLSGRALTQGELVALFSLIGDTPGGRRDVAILALGYGCGLRRAELVGLDLADVIELPGGVRLRVLGKGNKEREAFVSGNVLDALRRWREARGDAPGPLFVPITKWGTVARKLTRLDPNAVYLLLRRTAARAKIARISPHDLRRTFASDLLDRGADISTVQGLMGHSSVTTTQRYDRRDERAKERASALLHVPIATKERG